MSRKAIFAVLLVALVAILPATVFAGGPVEKATGSIEYYQPGYFFNFSAHAEANGQPAKGEAWNYTPAGGWYHAEVHCVNVLATDEVLFAAELVETNMPSWGPWVLIQVHDGGEPGAGVDHIWGQFLNEATALDYCGNGTSPTGGGVSGWDVLSGNLQVHTYD